MTLPFNVPDDEQVKSALVTIDLIAAELHDLDDAMHSAYATENWPAFHDHQIEVLRGHHGRRLDQALTVLGRRARYETRPRFTRPLPRSRRRSRATP